MSGPGATPAVLCDGRVPTPSFTPTPASFRDLGFSRSRISAWVFPSGNLSGLARLISVSAFNAAAHAIIIGALLLAGNAFACMPAPWGTGSYPVTSTNAGQPHPDGEWAYWFCSTAYKTTWEMRLRKTGAPIVIPSLKDKTPAQAFEAIEAANMTLSLDDPSLANLLAAAFKHLDEHIPPDPLWAVAKNGTTLTRPVYVRNADGTLGAVDKTLRATVGEQCQCSETASRVVSGTSTYCTWKVDQPARVTLCKAVP